MAPPGTQIDGPAAFQLWVQSGDLPPHVLDLKPGRNIIGRSPAAHLQLDHPTVSELHCEIDLGAHSATVRDLESTNGTFVDGEPVQVASLRPGQTLQLGSVELRCEPGTAPVASPMLEVAESGHHPAFPPDTCANHPSARAGWICSDCGRSLCGACVKQIQLERNKTAPICPNCQGFCERATAIRQRGDPNQFGTGLLQALAYPLRGDCRWMLLAITAVSLVIQFGSRVPGVRTIAWMLSFAVGAYALLFVREVILSATDGGNNTPPWPELDRTTALEVALLWMGTTTISFGPWLLCRFWLGTETEALRWLCHGLLAAGFLYFPMAVLATVLNDSLSAANPVLVFVSIFRSPARYLTLCGFIGALFGGTWLLEQALTGIAMSILPLVLIGAAQFYAVVAAARALGWFYYCSKDKLGWS